MIALCGVFLRHLSVQALLAASAGAVLTALLAGLEGRSFDWRAWCALAPLSAVVATWAAERTMDREGVFRAWEVCGGGPGLWRLTVAGVVTAWLSASALVARPEPMGWLSSTSDGWRAEVGGVSLGYSEGRYCRGDLGPGPVCPVRVGARLPLLPARRVTTASGLGTLAAVWVAGPRRRWGAVLAGLLAGAAAVVLAS